MSEVHQDWGWSPNWKGREVSSGRDRGGAMNGAGYEDPELSA
jgi:hypothetical protein